MHIYIYTHIYWAPVDGADRPRAGPELPGRERGEAQGLITRNIDSSTSNSIVIVLFILVIIIGIHNHIKHLYVLAGTFEPPGRERGEARGAH